MDLSKSIAWVAFAAIVGVVGVGKDDRDDAVKPAAKPADSRPLKTQVAQRDSRTKVLVARPVSDRSVPVVRSHAP